LAQIQQEIQSGQVDSSDVIFVTGKAKKDRREHLPWTSTELFQYITCLKPYKFGSTHDFLGAEWCLDSYNNWHPCDAYAMRYDSDRGCRLASGLEVYFKFSVNDQGGLVLVVISLHPSKWSDK
jgi:hypothetical protein